MLCFHSCRLEGLLIGARQANCGVQILPSDFCRGLMDPHPSGSSYRFGCSRGHVFLPRGCPASHYNSTLLRHDTPLWLEVVICWLSDFLWCKLQKGVCRVLCVVLPRGTVQISRNRKWISFDFFNSGFTSRRINRHWSTLSADLNVARRRHVDFIGCRQMTGDGWVFLARWKFNWRALSQFRTTIYCPINANGDSEDYSLCDPSKAVTVVLKLDLCKVR